MLANVLKAMNGHANNVQIDLPDDNHERSNTSAKSRSRSSSVASSSSLGSIFESSLTLLGSLPVATASKHWNDGQSQPYVIHTSQKFGKFKLHLADVSSFDELRLQSHYLWPAGVKLAEMIEDGEIHVRDETGEQAKVFV